MIEDRTFTIKLSHLILVGVIFLVLLLLKCDPNPPVDKYIQQKKKISILQDNIISLENDQNILTDNVNKQVIVIDSLEGEINITGQELIQTRIYYGNKIKDLTSASDSELEQFFSNRYQ